MANRNIYYGAGAAGAVAIAYFATAGGNALPRTFGVQNIENRYSAGGGSKNHLPGASTPRGNSEKVMGNTMDQQGFGSEAFVKQKNEMQIGDNANSHRISDRQRPQDHKADAPKG